jgi:hypothetical protein
MKAFGELHTKAAEAHDIAVGAGRSRAVEHLGRAGFAACGVIYALIGALAVKVALGDGAGEAADPRGALHTIAAQPFGRFLVGAVAVGFSAMTLWNVVQALLDPQDRGTDTKGIVVRAVHLIVAAVWTALAIGAFQIVLGGDMDADGERSATATLLSKPFGAVAVVVVGLGVVASGVVMLYAGATRKFMQWEDLVDHDDKVRRVLERLGQVGLSAKGIVMGITGVFLVSAGVKSSAEEARGLDGALAEVVDTPFGPALLVAIALGLVAFGAYSVALAKYKKMT